MAEHSNIARVAESAEGRRGFLNRFAGVSSGLFVAAAARGAARRGDIPAANFACCDLAFPNGPFCHSCGTSCWTCPSGYHTAVWYCCSAGRLWGCGECQQGGGSNCFGGSKYKCSFPFHTGVPC
jgi:hypothetical protein